MIQLFLIVLVYKSSFFKNFHIDSMAMSEYENYFFIEDDVHVFVLPQEHY